MLIDEKWMLSAACEGCPGLMFPDEDDPEAVAAAKSLCGVCVVREDCLVYALSRNERFGVWGGMGETERRLHRRRSMRRQLEESRRPADAPVQIAFFTVENEYAAL